MKVYYWRTQLKYHWGWETKKEGVTLDYEISLGKVYHDSCDGLFRNLSEIRSWLKNNVSKKLKIYPDSIDIQFEYKEVDLDWDKL